MVFSSPVFLASHLNPAVYFAQSRLVFLLHCHVCYHFCATNFQPAEDIM